MNESARTVTVTGLGSAQATPGHFTINIGIEATQPTVRAAYAAAAAAARAVSSTLLAKGVRQDAVSSSALDVRVETRWQDGLGTVVTGYTVSSTMAVPLDYGQESEDVIAAVVETGNNHVRLHGLTPVVSDPADAADQARTAAWDDAVRAATLYAARAGRALGEVIGVVEVTAPHGGPRPVMARAAMAMDSASMPITAGQSEVTIAVQVTWELL